jgi:DNA-directed RNA polymerase subunit RPC12/RpoP
MRLRTQCRACGLPFRAEIDGSTRELACPDCGVSRPVATDGWSDRDPRRVEACPLCGCKHLYRQRDVHRAWGCALVALGAALVPWTYGLSLVALGLVDLYLHRRLRDAVVCYRCDTAYRDAVPLDRQGEFDLLKHDVLKYGKSWDSEGDDDRIEPAAAAGGGPELDPDRNERS